MNAVNRVKSLLLNFSGTTNIHGFAYVAQPARCRIEKLFWLLSIVISFILTCLLIHKLMLENQRNPTVIYTDQSIVHVTEIFFPAITLTPGLILKTPLVSGVDYMTIKQRVEEKSVDLAHFNVTHLKQLQVASLIARDGFMARHFNRSIDTSDLVRVMRKDFPTLWWFREEKRLKELPRVVYFFYGNWSESSSVNFTEILCPTGLCYTFNMPDKRGDLWRVEKLAEEMQSENFVRVGMHLKHREMFVKPLESPVRGTKSGKGLFMRIYRKYSYINNGMAAQEINANLSLLTFNNSVIKRPTFSMDIYEHSLPVRDTFGTPFIIHDPYEVPVQHVKKYHTLTQHNLKVLITPRVTKYDDTLAAMDANERQCYLPNERHLQFFTAYNRINCEHECLSNLTLVSCGCTQFFMVRAHKTRICGIFDEKCFRKIEKEFQNSKDSCKCFDLCERVEYDVRERFEKEYTQREHPSIHFNFAVEQVLPQSRRKQQTVVGFLSLVGGFFGLFAGFSVLAGFELLFGFTLEPFVSLFCRNTRVYPLTTQNQRLMAIRSYCSDFSGNTTVHGFNHIGDEKKSFLERVIWLLLFTLAMIGSYLMVAQVLNSQAINQVVTTMEGRATPVAEIPFPAITLTDRVHLFSYQLNFLVMEQLAAYRGEVSFDYVYNLAEFMGVNNLHNQVLANVCFDDKAVNFLLHKNFRFNHSSQLVSYLKNERRDTKYWPRPLQDWIWNGFLRPPLVEVLSMRGIARTFNLLPEEKLLNFKSISRDFHYAYKNDSQISSLPWSTSAGNEYGLVVEITQAKRDAACADNYFAIHAPNELPLGIPFNVVKMRNSFDVTITPEIIKVDDEIRALKVEERNCYFEKERKLEYFEVYTKQNCEVECTTRVAYEKCKCVPFYFIRNSTMVICDYRKYILCILQLSKDENFGDHQHKFDTTVCECRPLCNSIVYKYEATEMYAKEDNKSEKRAKISFRYKDGEYFALLRYQPFKVVDFLSFVGGILGLFAGVSVLSIVEVIYFFTLRVLSNVVRKLRRM